MSRAVRLIRNVVLPAIPVALAAPVAKAQVIYTNLGAGVNIGAAQSIYFDLDHSGPGDGTSGFASTSNLTGADFRITFGFGNSAKPVLSIYGPGLTAVVQNGSTFAANLAPDTPIDAGANWRSNTTSINTNGANNFDWPASGNAGYLGLRLDVGGGQFDYAWAGVTYNVNQSITLHDFAYNSTADQALQAGHVTAVPEPSTYAALAGLLAGSAVLFAKRRKQAA